MDAAQSPQSSLLLVLQPLVGIPNVFAALALVNVMLLADVICSQATGGTDSGAYNRACTSAHHAADYRAANGRAADDLGLGVMAGVMPLLHVLGVLVLIGLRAKANGRDQHGREHHLSCELLNRH
jgi:hypothetical protein